MGRNEYHVEEMVAMIVNELILRMYDFRTTGTQNLDLQLAKKTACYAS